MNSTSKSTTPPHSKESEMMVLGCMLTSINGLNIAAVALDDSDFYFTEHKVAFQVLKAAHKNDKPADIHLIAEELKRQDKLSVVGGLSYLTTLAQYAGTSAFIEEYVKVVQDKAFLRRIIHAAQQVEKAALEEPLDVKKALEDFQEIFAQISRAAKLKSGLSIKFLDDFDQNFLLVEPTKKPALLEYANEKGAIVGFIPKGIVAMLVGAGGVGKTHLLAQLAISIAMGSPWLDIFTTTNHCGVGKKGNVFLEFGENQYDDIHRVLYKASKKLRKQQPDILKDDPLLEASKKIAAVSFCGQASVFIEKGKPTPYYRELKMKLIEGAPKEGWALIILDPISRLMGADAEVDNAAATQFIALLEELTIDLPGNPTVLFAHHVSKSAINESKQNQTAARGASALSDGVRWQVNFSRDENDNLALKMTKSNFTALMDEIILERDDDGYLKKSKNAIRIMSLEDKKKRFNNSDEIIGSLYK